MFHPVTTNKRFRAAFTLVELMVSSAVACGVGLIAYSVATENLVAFEKNFSINRSYGDARRSLDRIAVAMQSAGHVPVLIDATGASTTTSPAPGIRFWRNSSTPCYPITTPAAASTSITLTLAQPGTTSPNISPPIVGDMITIPLLGFQAQCTAVTSTGTTATVSFATSIASKTSPAITSVPTTASVINNGGQTVQQTIQYTCLDWRSVAFIAVGNQLRYYSNFISGTSNVNTAHYEVIAYLIPTAPTLPFSLGSPPSINIDLYAQAPDFSNTSHVSTADTYTYLETALSPRNPTLLYSPY